MNTLLRITLVIGCLLAALGCYAFGIPAGGVVFLFLGLIFEGLFWFGLFGKKNRATSK